MSFQWYFAFIFFDDNAVNNANINESLSPSVGHLNAFRMFSLRHSCVLLDCNDLNYANINESIKTPVDR
jgi:hypothetical protein